MAQLTDQEIFRHDESRRLYVTENLKKLASEYGTSSEDREDAKRLRRLATQNLMGVLSPVAAEEVLEIFEEENPFIVTLEEYCYVVTEP